MLGTKREMSYVIAIRPANRSTKPNRFREPALEYSFVSARRIEVMARNIGLRQRDVVCVR